MKVTDRNNFSISTDELATGLQNSAAALSVAGNSLDESIALMTAGNAITQDASRTGNGLRMIALRMTGTEEAKAEAEAMGEDVSDFVVQTQSKIDKQLRDYTAVASNNFKGVSLLDENGNYRSTYQVLQDIADIYDEIVETDKQFGTNKMNGLLELIAGKSRSNIAASVLQNGDMLRSVYQQSQNAEGSALEENEKYLDSIDGKIQQAQNRLQEFASLAINSDVFKGLVDGATSFLEVLNNIIQTAGMLPTILGVGGIAGIAKNIPSFASIGEEILAVKNIRNKDGVVDSKGLGKIFAENKNGQFSDIVGVKEFGRKYGIGDVDLVEGIKNASKENKELASSFEQIVDVGGDASVTMSNFVKQTSKTGEKEGAKSVGVLGKAFEGLKSTISSVWGILSANPILTGAVLGTAAIVGGAMWYDKRYDRQKEQADTAIETSDKSTSDLEETKTKLEEVGSKIDEIKSKGKLSLTDQAELANLQAQKDELEAIKSLQEETVKNDKADANKEAIKALEMDEAAENLTDERQTASTTSTKYYGKTKLLQAAEDEVKRLNTLKDERQKMQDEMNEAVKDGDKERQKQLQDDIDTQDATIKKAKEHLMEHYNDIKDLQKGLDAEDTENGGQKWFNKTQNAIDDILYSVDDSKTPIERMKKILDNAFKGNGEQAAKFGDSISDYLTKSVESGKTAFEGLKELGLTMKDLGFDWKNMDVDERQMAIDALNQQFKDLAKSATDAKDAIKNVKPAVDGTFEGVQKAQESANAGANWESNYCSIYVPKENQYERV